MLIVGGEHPPPPAPIKEGGVIVQGPDEQVQDIRTLLSSDQSSLSGKAQAHGHTSQSLHLFRNYFISEIKDS